MREIRFDVSIEAEPKLVYQALTEREPMERWWAECYLKPEIGSDAVFFFRSVGAYKRMVVENLVPERLVEWRCVEHFYNGTTEWKGTTIRFELSKNARGGTDLRFVHGNWSDSSTMFEECVEGWRHFITESLKNFLETGTGEPFEVSFAQGWRPPVTAGRN